MDSSIKTSDTDKERTASLSDTHTVTDSDSRNNHQSTCDVTPPDGGWGWVVVAGAFYISACIFGAFLSFGILFSEPLLSMGVSSTTTAWIVNIYFFLFNISTTLATPLCEMFSWRSVAFFGCLTASSGYTLLYFATTPLHIFLLFSLLTGTAAGLSFSVCLLVVPAYFDKHRGAAISVVMSGVAFGQLSVPLILRSLLDALGFRGAILIFGAVLSNCCIAALMFHPVERHQKKIKKGTRMNDAKEVGSVEEFEYLKQSIDNKTIEETSRRKDFLESSKEKSSALVIFFKTTIKHLQVMRQYRVSLATASLACLVVGYANFNAQLPFAMLEAGHEPKHASFCLSVSGICNALIRIFTALLSDRRWFNRKWYYVISSFMAGCATLLVVLGIKSFEWIIFSLILWGTGIAASLSVFYALLLDISGREHYAPAVAVSGFFLAVVGIVIGPFFGLIRDLSSYSWSMGACGVLQIVCALIWVLMPYAITRDARINQRVT